MSDCSISPIAFAISVAITIGCNPAGSSQGSGVDDSPPAQRQPDVDNRLLARLEGQTTAQKAESLLAIIQNDPDDSVRRDALDYVRELGPDASSIVGSLAEQLLNESDPSLLFHLKEVLASIKTDVDTYLLSATETANQSQLLRIIEALGDLKSSSPETIAFLQERLSTTDQSQLLALCTSLGKIGPPAKQAMLKLIEIASRPRISIEGSTDGGRAFRDSRNLQGAAIRAIAAIGPDEKAIQVLTSALAAEPQIAKVAAEALGTIGPAAASAVPELLKLEARNDHGGKDIKTRQAIEAATEAIRNINREF